MKWFKIFTLLIYIFFFTRPMTLEARRGMSRSAAARSCHFQQKIIRGALEMGGFEFLREGPQKLPFNLDIKELITKDYLKKEPVCPKKHPLIIHILDSTEYFVFCTYHGPNQIYGKKGVPPLPAELKSKLHPDWEYNGNETESFLEKWGNGFFHIRDIIVFTTLIFGLLIAWLMGFFSGNPPATQESTIEPE